MQGLAPTLLAALFCAGQLAAQEQEPPASAPDPRKVQVVAPPGAVVDPTAPKPAVWPLKDRGKGFSGSILEQDRSVPLPIERRVRPGTGSDIVEAEAAGDPFFLGFVAGPYSPPADERLDPQLLAKHRARPQDRRPADEIYAYVMLAERYTPALEDELRDLGARFLEFVPHHSFRAAIRADRLENIAYHRAVRWVGAARTWQKLEPRLQARLMDAAPTEVLDIVVNLSESDLCADSTSKTIGVLFEGGPGIPPQVRYDESQMGKVWMSNGWQQRAAEAQGLAISEYLRFAQAFHAQATPAVIAALLELDFVSYIEQKAEISLDHDESTPLVNSDAARALHDGGTNQASYAGVFDSGLETTHPMFSHIAFVGWDYTLGFPSAGALPAIDPCGHGTHVTGTILGSPFLPNLEHRGNAPGLGFANNGRFRIVRTFGPGGCATTPCCWTSAVSLETNFAHFTNAYTDGGGQVTPKAHVVNNSWGAGVCNSSCGCSAPWNGADANSRSADAISFNGDVLLVFSAGNSGQCGAGFVGSPGAAKNILTVGSVNDFYTSVSDTPGTLSFFSDRGPVGDGRWKPNVVAPGHTILSAQAGGTNGYVEMSGTSMAAPHVTGIAAQLTDAHPFLRNAPARLSALLMGTALSKADERLESPTANATHLNNYGAGRVEALLAQTQQSWYSSENWGFTMTPGASFQFDDITVPAGAQRLIVCMTYHEPAASSGASQALRSNLDLWIDRDPIDPAGNTGEFSSHQSSINNTELRYIDAPPAGLWRWKVFPTSLIGTTKVSVQVVIVTARTSPRLELSLVGHPWEKTGNFNIEVAVDAEEGIASGVHVSQLTQRTLPLPGLMTTIGAYSWLKDGLIAWHKDNANLGDLIALGNVLANDPRQAWWRFSSPNESTFVMQVTADADNTGSVSAQFTVQTDANRPTAPSGLISTSHQRSIWSNNPNIAFQWSAGTDARSGVDGYSALYSTSPTGNPDELIEIGAVTTTTRTNGTTPVGQGIYLHLRTVDRAGWGSSTWATEGPYLIDLVEPTLPTLTSSTHTAGVWTNVMSFSANITGAADAHSGLDGYSRLVDTSSTAVPPASRQLPGGINSDSIPLSSNASGQYYKLRLSDRAGNWTGGFASFGPILVDNVAPSAPTGLSSSAASWTNDPNVAFLWTAASDAHSGIQGYATAIGSAPGVSVGTTPNVGAVNTTTATLASNGTPQYFALRSVDRAGNASATTTEIGPIRVDIGAPTAPTGLTSPTHPVNGWSAQDVAFVNFTPATDALSGIAGYRAVWDQTASTVVNSGATNLANFPYQVQSPALASSAAGYYLHLAARDVAGNYGPTAHYGPFRIDFVVPTAPSNPSSTTHALNTWDRDAVVRVNFIGSSDVHSGLAGYRAQWDTTPSTAVTSAVTTNPVGTTQIVSPTLATSNAGYYLHLAAIDNAGNVSSTLHYGPFRIDTTMPLAPTAISSTTHTLNTWSNQATIGFQWTNGSDAHSGLAQTAVLLASGNPVPPNTGGTFLPATTTSTSLPAIEGNAIYFTIAHEDVAGNWGSVPNAGPYRVDLSPPTGASLDIASGATTTTSHTVQLTIAASDALSGLNRMRFRNRNNAPTAWIPFATTYTWNIAAGLGLLGTGTTTVTVEVEDVAGNIASATDAIQYVILPTTFGNACAGAAGTPDITVSGIPTLGGSMTLASTPTTAATSSLYFGFSNQTWLGIPLPFDLGLVGLTAGCELHVSPDIALYSGPNAPVVLPIPNDGLLANAEIFFQWHHYIDPSGKLVVTSPGARVTLNAQ
ncbi:MAG: S8 family serine peptidase [Planctomycetes bacterium]|nr:S8 family serine peptidase [Planctomycetota bacterium]